MAKTNLAAPLRAELRNLKTKTLRNMAQAVSTELICSGNFHSNGSPSVGCLFTAACTAPYKTQKKRTEIIDTIMSQDGFRAVADLTGEDLGVVNEVIGAFDGWAGRDSKSELVNYTVSTTWGEREYSEYVLKPHAQRELLAIIEGVLAERA